ncbi:hypothetical protein [Legionella septentrionalis]|uniref:Uncharacterized protein n=1 Tax=Legionella septentrionalis TaxID=2498109 RepID=A0A433JGP5_9GAMM|nr:hypothetical protein [Legionella septentrionalis]RUQ81018.1 hypothetical protein EKM59_10900 [Legionella septentrionalis]RUQ99346.1 hypothetical protein ELY11_04810 [Legionella septentrionalis]RUR08765.1 hypothetical protein ELY14_10725 [Legionella septentrionalis]
MLQVKTHLIIDIHALVIIRENPFSPGECELNFNSNFKDLLNSCLNKIASANTPQPTEDIILHCLVSPIEKTNKKFKKKTYQEEFLEVPLQWLYNTLAEEEIHFSKEPISLCKDQAGHFIYDKVSIKKQIGRQFPAEKFKNQYIFITLDKFFYQSLCEKNVKSLCLYDSGDINADDQKIFNQLSFASKKKYISLDIDDTTFLRSHSILSEETIINKNIVPLYEKMGQDTYAAFLTARGNPQQILNGLPKSIQAFKKEIKQCKFDSQNLKNRVQNNGKFFSNELVKTTTSATFLQTTMQAYEYKTTYALRNLTQKLDDMEQWLTEANALVQAYKQEQQKFYSAHAVAAKYKEHNMTIHIRPECFMSTVNTRQPKITRLAAIAQEMGEGILIHLDDNIEELNLMQKEVHSIKEQYNVTFIPMRVHFCGEFAEHHSERLQHFIMQGYTEKNEYSLLTKPIRSDGYFPLPNSLGDENDTEEDTHAGCCFCITS